VPTLFSATVRLNQWRHFSKSLGGLSNLCGVCLCKVLFLQ